MIYKVFVDDNYHYMDKDKRYTHGNSRPWRLPSRRQKR